MANMQYQAKDFSSEAEIRWCPGCGDYIILKQLQMALAKSGSIPHQTAVISGIGCSSRLPYYMNTYGFHTIHGRALPIATGLKKTKPELEVWVATGDGDSLSIGTNHFVHCLRRDIDINIILFNNKIYGLTKGQYSPTSDLGQYSKSTPQGSEEAPLNVMELALASGAKFIARSADRFASHLQEVFIKSKNHYGTSFVEVLQNCPIFNDGIFDIYTQKDQSKNNIIFLEEGSPIVFGDNNDLTIVIENLKPKITKLSEVCEENLWIHEKENKQKALILSQLGFEEFSNFPLPFGIIFEKNEKKSKMSTKAQLNDFQLINVIKSRSFEIS